MHAEHGDSTTHNGYVVDLSELESIDGGGLRALEAGAALCQLGSRELVLVAPPPISNGSWRWSSSRTACRF